MQTAEPKESPASVELEFETDLITGWTFGRRLAANDQALGDQDRIQQRLLTAISSVFPQAACSLTSKIEAHTAAGAHHEAAVFVSEGTRDGSFLRPNPQLLRAMERIDLTRLSNDYRQEVREVRVAISASLNRFDAAEPDVTALLKEYSESAKIDRISLQNLIALAAMQRGEVEAAILMWRRLIQTPEAVDPLNRGWIWRNLSKALPVDHNDAVRAAKRSVDAFLEGGDKRQAATSLMQLSNLLIHQNPDEAIAQINAMFDLVTQEGLIGNELRAAIHHALGNRLSDLGKHELAFASAVEAVKLRRNVLGADEALISSLHLAAVAAKAFGEHGKAEEFEQEATELETKTGSKHFLLVRRIAALFSNFDQDEAEIITGLANASGEIDLIACSEVAAVIANPQLGTSARLSSLEAILKKVERAGRDHRILHPVQTAMADVLYRDGQFDRAEIWLRRILSSHPVDRDARDKLLSCLWKNEDWDGAAIFLSQQIRQNGDLPGILCAYGQSLLNAGDTNGAVRELTRGLKVAGEGTQIREIITALRMKAIDLGGAIIPAPRIYSGREPVLREELEEALKNFGSFVSAHKRMGFWKQVKRDYDWSPYPERRAQDLLHTFLNARFQERISVFKELDAGAGRLDLFLKLEGGLAVVIELKMCGYGYSGAYAASGHEQIRHYMEAYATHLGYLIIQDARLDDFGRKLFVHGNNCIDTVNEIFIDLRPRVTSSRGKKTTK